MMKKSARGSKEKSILTELRGPLPRPEATVPSVVAERYGFRIAAIAKAWLDEGITDGHS